MSITCRIVPFAALLVALLVWNHGTTPALRGDAAEIARIRHHLEGAETLLHGRDLSTLTVTQRAARSRRIAELRAYRERGAFPHNHRLPGRRTPVVVDEHGTRCAMAYLIEQSGQRELVARIAETRNLARIRDLADEPELIAWLDRNGVTLAEAARIQPEYGDVTFTPPGPRAPWAGPAAGAGLVVVGLGLNVSSGESQEERNLRGLVGVVSGAVGAGLGAPALSEGGGPGVLGALDITIGVISIGLGIRQLNTGGGIPRDAHGLAPTLWMDRDGTRRVAVMARF